MRIEMEKKNLDCNVVNYSGKMQSRLKKRNCQSQVQFGLLANTKKHSKSRW